VTSAAFHGAVRAQQGKPRFGMVEAADVGPRARAVTSFATEKTAIGAMLRHSVIEFAPVRIFVTASTSQIVPTKGEDFIGPACSAYLVTLGATDRSVSAEEWIAGLPVHGHGIGREVKASNRVAVLAAVLVRRCGKLAVVLILVAIQTGGKFDFIDCIFSGGQMAFVAFDFDVFAF